MACWDWALQSKVEYILENEFEEIFGITFQDIADWWNTKSIGGMSEWFIVLALKANGSNESRGFESLSLCSIKLKSPEQHNTISSRRYILIVGSSKNVGVGSISFFQQRR